MKRLRLWGFALVLMSITFGGNAQGFDNGLGVRGGIGTDITFGGVAFGGGLNYLFLKQFEVGLVVYYGSFEETTEENIHTYEETTSITAVALFLNFLYGYKFGENSPFLVAGVGLGYIGVDWEERSDTDTSLGTLLPGGGSKQEVSGSLAGALINLGAGYAFDFGLDLRFEVPILFAFGETGGASVVIPLFTLNVGYRFRL